MEAAGRGGAAGGGGAATGGKEAALLTGSTGVLGMNGGGVGGGMEMERSAA